MGRRLVNGDEECCYSPGGLVAGVGGAVEDVVGGGTVAGCSGEVAGRMANSEDGAWCCLFEFGGSGVEWVFTRR